MATEDSHREQAEHNQRFLESIDVNRFPDCVATVAFYKAVHLAEIVLVKKGHKSGSHIKRNKVLKTTFPQLWMDYRPLYAFSRMTRYRCYKATKDNITYILRRLRRVEETTTSLCK